jgi:glucose-6-phosphate 1-dehydrogenase
MEAPVRADSESVRDEKVKVLKAIPPLTNSNVVRGQFRGYKAEKGVAPEWRTETFVALRLEVDSWRWEGAPFFIRAGKCLPATSTDVLVRLRRPPLIYRAHAPVQNHIRLRISPEVTIAMGMMVLGAGQELTGEAVEMVASSHPRPEEMDAYEKVLGDAMAGDATLFARQDYVEEAWRIVDPLLKADTLVYEYESGTWGPVEAAEGLAPSEGWNNPMVANEPAVQAEVSDGNQ